ncbi:MAG TPA: translation elongation factor Ts, partial [Pseudomonadales bacterium]|nr:translation elongation factor Ts [Pseudomonadales bacterium]
GIMVEVNSQTDFVARDANFTAFANLVADQVLATGNTDIASLMESSVNGETLEAQRQALVQKIGENIQVRRAQSLTAEGVVGAYVHGLKIGVLVGLKGGDAELAKDVAMHVAAVNPMVIDESQIPAETLAKEHEIYTAQAAESGKPADIVEKMVQGRLRKYKEEVSLVHQGFVKDPDTKVGDLLKKASATVQQFARFQVGEGIEKKEVDFAAEVAAAAAASK